MIDDSTYTNEKLVRGVQKISIGAAGLEELDILVKSDKYVR